MITKLLKIELHHIAYKLGFISKNIEPLSITDLYECIAQIDEISRIPTDQNKKMLMTMASLLWEYRNKEWDGLREILIVALSRAGFSPSTILLDESYADGVYSDFESYFNKINTTIYQMRTSISIGDKVFLLTAFQHGIWEKYKKVSSLGISAPTSAGKSFVILLIIAETIRNQQGQIVYIVPTLSLVSQVSCDIRNTLKVFQMSNVRIMTSFNQSENIENCIYVLTQEKASAAFSQIDKPFKNLLLLVVDEIQNIERVADQGDQRAKTLYDVIMDFRHECFPKKTIISGPRIEGIKKLAEGLFGEVNTAEEETKSSPVTNITYAICKTKSGYILKQYSDVIKRPHSLPIASFPDVNGFGESRYSDDFHKYLSQIIARLGSDRNIIFSPTSDQSRKTAAALARIFEQTSSPNENGDIKSLAKYIEDTIHKEYDLIKTIKQGVAYHHGKMPMNVRFCIEHAIREKMIQNVICTTTLMQGVNLPAQNVIMRTPYLSINKKSGVHPMLTNYEIANLRGRAGRLLKDTIGRTIVLEENSFEQDSKQETLFADEEKSLNSGYGDKYYKHESDIVNILKNGERCVVNSEFAFLVAYIRQTILRYKFKSKDRLSVVGIEFDHDLIEEVLKTMSSLHVSKQVCFKNRYWDPFDLNEIKKYELQFKLPLSAAERNISNTLKNVLIQLSKIVPHQYSKQLGDLKDGALQSLSIASEKWMKEEPLHKILNTKYFDSSDKIESEITRLQNVVSYGIPLLLKPVYDIVAPESMFLRYIEIGAYKPFTRKIIEMGLPRETAISIVNMHIASQKNEISYSEIIAELIRIKPKLSYWEKVQVDMVI